MKQINGKKYYITIGYIDPEILKDGVDIKNLKSIQLNSDKNKEISVYYDNSDPQHPIALPLLPVNEIQKRGDKFNFRVLVNPKNLAFTETDIYHKLNVVGLFAEYKKDGVEYIKHISFYQLNRTEYLTRTSSAVTLSVDENVISIMSKS